jgi:hypothetical protein
MAKSSRLVIDTSIARSAGTSEDVTSQQCRQFMESVRDKQHQIVVNTVIYAEWKRHQSKFSADWLKKMFSSRQVVKVANAEDKELRTKIAQSALSEKQREAVLKDTFLLEAALLADKIVASRDETVRNLFIELTTNIGMIRMIVWVNPTIASEGCIDWLKDGCKADKVRQLGYKPDDTP